MYLETINLSPLKIENCFYATEDFFNCRKIMDKFPAFTGYDLVIYYKIQIVLREAKGCFPETEINDLADYIHESPEKLLDFLERTHLDCLKSDLVIGTVVTSQNNEESHEKEKAEQLLKIKKILLDKGVTSICVDHIFKKFEVQYIQEKIKLTNNANPDNWPGFFRRAVEQNYQENKPESISPYRNPGYDEDLYLKMQREYGVKQ